MKRLFAAAALAAVSFTAAAQAPPKAVRLGASEQSSPAPASTQPVDAAKQAKVKELFAAMHVERASEQMIKTMQGMVAHAADGAPGAQDATPEQKKLMADYQQKAMDLAIGAVGWKAMEPVYVQLYASEFTDAELDGMIAFYQSPAGKALLDKMPDITQQTVKVVQERMQGLQPQIQQLTNDFMEKMKATPAPAKAAPGK